MYTRKPIKGKSYETWYFEAANNMRCKFPENFEPKYTLEQIREINNHK